MKISNISDFLGGANNVKALEVIRGEQVNFQGTVRDADSEILDITNFTITAVAEYYKATVTGNAKAIEINTFEAYAKDDKTITITKADDPSTGKFTLTIPSDLADDADTADLDAQNGVLVVPIFITYNDGGNPATIRKNRVLTVVRHSG